MKLNEFFNKHPVFRLDEIDNFLAKRGEATPSKRNSLLSYYRRQGRVITVRRKLYAVVPYGVSPQSHSPDPFLLAAKITPDAVLAYHTALEFYGKAYSVFNRYYYLSDRKSVPVHFRDYDFRFVKIPHALKSKGKEDYGVVRAERAGLDTKVTSLERTLVDVLDRPDISGSWEEIWRSLESVEFFDIDKVIEYALLLGNATTAAKTGFFLDQHRETLMVDDSHLKLLRDLRPKQPHYLERSKRKSGRLVSDWNLVVPEYIIERSWMEVL
jgi:predicted transcriptional regulator of viral defense system